MNLSHLPGAAALFAVLTLSSPPFLPSSFGQTNSTNISGTANTLQATASNSAIVTGLLNNNAGTNSAIIGAAGSSVQADLRQAFIGGANAASIRNGAHNAAILGGLNNMAAVNASRSVVVGGFSNTVAVIDGAAVGGQQNVVTNNGTRGFIGGGQFNEVRAPGGAVVGGFANEAAGTNSFAAGSQAVASNTGTFVWADMSSATDFVSTGNNQFLIRANGGVGINTANPQGNALFVNGNLRVTGRIVSENNQASAPGAAVAGGRGNLATNIFTFVGGGENNIAGGTFSIVVGGGENTNRGGGAFIGGGFANSITNGSSGSVIGGGIGNRITVTNIASPQNFEAAATIAGGVRNEAAGYRSTVGGGEDNRAGSAHDIVAGGRANAAHGGTSAILGGFENAITNSSESAIVGGFQNRIDGGNFTGGNNFIGGGAQNTNRGSFATIGGGRFNTVTASNAVVGGGQFNRAAATNSVIGGGQLNTNRGRHSFIGGGQLNIITAGADQFGGGASILGGLKNEVTAAFATVTGGTNNRATASGATVIGGLGNVASGIQAIAGGEGSMATGTASIALGVAAEASGNLSRAFGVNAKATNRGSTVIGSDLSVSTVSVADDSFTVRAPGGVRFITTKSTTNISTAQNILFGGTNGVILAARGTSWESLSDSNSKTNFEAVKPREILYKVAAMPVTSWHYKHDLERRYIGPTAQDFHAAFGLGSDDKTISTLDSDGVMYAAIQGLVEEIQLRDKKIAQLEAWSREQGARSQAEIQDLRAKSAELDDMKMKLQVLEQRLNSLPPAP